MYSSDTKESYPLGPGNKAIKPWLFITTQCCELFLLQPAVMSKALDFQR